MLQPEDVVLLKLCGTRLHEQPQRYSGSTSDAVAGDA